VQGNLPNKNKVIIFYFLRSKMISATVQFGGSVHKCGLKIGVSASVSDLDPGGQKDPQKQKKSRNFMF
jgi:hypothetical protein